MESSDQSEQYAWGPPHQGEVTHVPAEALNSGGRQQLLGTTENIQLELPREVMLAGPEQLRQMEAAYHH